MSSNRDALEISIHLEDGKVVRFAAADSLEARRIVQHLQPERLFTDRLLVLGDATSMTTVPLNKVVRIDLAMDEYPSWPFHHGAQDVREITEQEFRAQYRVDAYNLGEPSSAIAERISIYQELELSDGEHVWAELEVRREQIMPQDLEVLLQQFFTSGGIHFRRAHRGVSIVNTAHILRLTVYPAPLHLPPGAWRVNALRD